MTNIYTFIEKESALSSADGWDMMDLAADIQQVLKYSHTFEDKGGCSHWIFKGEGELNDFFSQVRKKVPASVSLYQGTELIPVEPFRYR